MSGCDLWESISRPYPFTLRAYHDRYKERIEALIKSKKDGEIAQVEEKKPKKLVATGKMEATATSLTL